MPIVNIQDVDNGEVRHGVLVGHLPTDKTPLGNLKTTVPTIVIRGDVTLTWEDARAVAKMIKEFVDVCEFG